jgi:outer membrane protein OmpA-like peptidoglycan-associated protein
VKEKLSWIYRDMRSRCRTFAVFALLALAACQSAPVQHAGFTDAQIAMLKQQGFQQNDDGWFFGLADKVLFDTDADVVKTESRTAIERVGRALVGVGITHLRVDGYTDASGSDAYNLHLSQARADAVANVLIEAGMPREAIHSRGLGKQNPVADNSTAAGRAENRRVALIVSTP